MRPSWLVATFALVVIATLSRELEAGVLGKSELRRRRDFSNRFFAVRDGLKPRGKPTPGATDEKKPGGNVSEYKRARRKKRLLALVFADSREAER